MKRSDKYDLWGTVLFGVGIVSLILGPWALEWWFLKMFNSVGAFISGVLGYAFLVSFSFGGGNELLNTATKIRDQGED